MTKLTGEHLWFSVYNIKLAYREWWVQIPEKSIMVTGRTSGIYWPLNFGNISPVNQGPNFMESTQEKLKQSVNREKCHNKQNRMSGLCD